jgi:hypothetical protein
MIILPPNLDSPHSKLQVAEGMWNGFDFHFFSGQDSQDWQDFVRLRRDASGRRPLYPGDPVDPVQLFFKDQNPFLF